MSYTAALDALDKKWCRTITVADWHAAGEKRQHDPGSLTDDDITIIEGFSGQKAGAEARALREKANEAGCWTAEPPPVTKKPPAPSGVQFPDRMWNDDAADPVKEMERWSETNAMKAVPIVLWHFFVSANRQKREALETKVETLEREIAALKARPLQKWAGVHVTGVPYAEASLVTKAGSLWAATAATTTTPGEPGSDWRLIVKKGHGA